MLSRREIDFLTYEWLNIEQLFSQDKFAAHSRGTLDPILDLSEKLAEDKFLNHYQQSDAQEPWLEDDGVHVIEPVKAALADYADLGLFAAGFPEENGGLGLPFLAYTAIFANFVAANISTAGFALVTAANARTLLSYGSAQQVETFALPQVAGKWTGTMCLSEPHAGSSLGDILTRAEPDGEDAHGPRYRLTGNKMWISGGDHDVTENIVHLVLAKIPDEDGQLPAGSGGISLFIVPKFTLDGEKNDVTVAGLNHKMGFRGIPNCALNFGENGGALGWRIGEPGAGLKQMFMMMNEARIMVGLCGAALAYRGYVHSSNYARERAQGRIKGQNSGKQVPIISHSDVRHMLLKQKAFGEGGLALVFYAAMLVDTPGEEAEALLSLLTPIVKTWPSEQGLAANDCAIQIHGGYGYTRDFPVEQLLRDNRLNPIHEGTTGIQAVDLLGRKLLMSDGRALKYLKARMAGTIAAAREDTGLTAHAGTLEKAIARIDEALGLLSDNADGAFDNATAFLRAFGHLVTGWLLLDQAVLAGKADQSDAFYKGKQWSCRYFFESEMPSLGAWLDLVVSQSDVAAAVPEEIFI